MRERMKGGYKAREDVRQETGRLRRIERFDKKTGKPILVDRERRRIMIPKFSLKEHSDRDVRIRLNRSDSPNKSIPKETEKEKEKEKM